MEEIVRLKLAFGLEMPLPELTPREAGLPEVGGKAHAIIGMRRAGKTFFVFQQLQRRLKSGVSRDRLVYFNFEDERLDRMRAQHLGLLIEAYYRVYPDYRHKSRVTFGLDEIQRVPGWESFIRRVLDEENAEILLTGSSAKLLSREISTAMRGRAVETTITPFSFREFVIHHGGRVPKPGKLLSAASSTKLLHAFDQYVNTGGFPEVQALSDRDWLQVLQRYVDVVLFRDIIERHNLTNVVALRALVRQLLRSGGTSLSINKLYNDFKSQGVRVSKESLMEYTQHLKDAFLIHPLEVHSHSVRRTQVNPRKIYVADHSLVKAFHPIPQNDIGHLLENIVACDLLRRARSVHYYKTKSGREVDFIAFDYSGDEHLIQVAASISNSDTLNRELRALNDAAVERPDAALLLLTMNDTQSLTSADGRKIQIMPIWQWLLE